MSETIDFILRSYAWNLAYAKALVADLDDAVRATSGGPGLENHPTWVLGHLVSGSDLLAEDLGLAREMPEAWRELFERRGPGDPRLPEDGADAYPSLGELFGELERQHDRVAAALREAAGRGALSEPIEWRFDGTLPTLGDVAVFLALNHESMHLGQLASWRRSRGLPSALAGMPR